LGFIDPPPCPRGHHVVVRHPTSQPQPWNLLSFFPSTPFFRLLTPPLCPLRMFILVRATREDPPVFPLFFPVPSTNSFPTACFVFVPCSPPRNFQRGPYQPCFRILYGFPLLPLRFFPTLWFFFLFSLGVVWETFIDAAAHPILGLGFDPLPVGPTIGSVHSSFSAELEAFGVLHLRNISFHLFLDLLPSHRSNVWTSGAPPVWVITLPPLVETFTCDRSFLTPVPIF